MSFVYCRVPVPMGTSSGDATPAQGFACWSFVRTALLLALLELGFFYGRAVYGANDGVTALAPVVVTASRLPVGASDLPVATTVIDRQLIEAFQPATILDVLELVPGLHVEQPGGPGGVSSVYFRGADPNFTLVKLDGVTLNDPTNSRGGSFDLSTLNIAAIERIEIASGSLSSVHGSGALAGVINIISRNPTDDLSLTAGLGHSTDGAITAHGTLSGPVGPLGVALTAARRDAGSPTTGNMFQNNELVGKLHFSPGDDAFGQVSFRHAESSSSSFPDDSGGPEFAVLREVDERNTTELSLSAELSVSPKPGFELSLKTSWAERNEEIFSPGVSPGLRDPFGVPANTFANQFYSANGTIQMSYIPSDTVQTVLGVEAKLEKGVSVSSISLGPTPVPGRFSLNRRLWAPFAEIAFRPSPAWHIVGGLRWNFPDSFSNEISAHADAVYSLASGNSQLRANWGQSFKLPSFFALGNSIVGNPLLRPETGESVEIGVSHSAYAGYLLVDATLFYSQYQNVIDLFEGPPPALVNRSKVVSYGLELSTRANFTDTFVGSANLVLLDTDIRETVEELRNRPNLRGSVGLRWRPKSQLSFSVKATFVGPVLDSSIPTGDRNLSSFVRVDSALSWQPNRRLLLTFAVDNLFDTDYEQAVGTSAPGISPRVATRVAF